MMSPLTSAGADDGRTHPQHLRTSRRRAARRRRRQEPLTTPLHHLLADGSFAVAVPVDAGAGGCPRSQALLELADYAPLPLREPVRSLVWIRGRLHQVPAADVTRTLDLIATEYPNPALLQVQTPDPGRPPMATPSTC